VSSCATAALAGGCFLEIAQRCLAVNTGVATACEPTAAARVPGKSKFVTSLRAESEAPELHCFGC
jgi:hypothetical protein